MRSSLLAAAIAALLIAVPSADARSRLCGGPLVTERGTYSVEIARGKTRCATARKVIRRYFNAPRGRCEGSSCLMRVRGYECITNRFTGGPAAARCQRKRVRLNAYLAGD